MGTHHQPSDVRERHGTRCRTVSGYGYWCPISRGCHKPKQTIFSHDCYSQAPAGMQELARGDLDGAHIAFAVDADAFEQWLARLAAQGVEVEAVNTWGRGGRSAYVRDPDGHSVELATPGVWETY
ncbi:MAG: VOC family protein [Candidatus Eisenbacteria bacterium]|nr:VOC family protein [Candidatus Eisenbacteria bacterium]